MKSFLPFPFQCASFLDNMNFYCLYTINKLQKMAPNKRFYDFYVIKRCEARSLVNSVWKKINWFNSRCLSHITGEDFAETTTHPLFDLIATFIMRRPRLAGHILRTSPERLFRQAIISYMCSNNPRPFGSPLHMCDDILIEEVTDIAGQKTVV